MLPRMKHALNMRSQQAGNDPSHETSLYKLLAIQELGGPAHCTALVL